MKVTLYMAITTNGYIADENGDTSWVCKTDWAELSKFVAKSDAVIMGRRTWEVSGSDFPYGNCLNVVLTNNLTILKETNNVLITNRSPKSVIEYLKQKNLKSVLIIGGGKTNSSFLKDGLIDEIVLSIHPLVLGQGIKLFDDGEFKVSLKLISVNKLREDLVQLRYNIIPLNGSKKD